jgi:hypothetical protein
VLPVENRAEIRRLHRAKEMPIKVIAREWGARGTRCGRRSGVWGRRPTDGIVLGLSVAMKSPTGGQVEVPTLRWSCRKRREAPAW